MGCVAGDFGEIYKTINGGTGWNPVSNTILAYLTSIYFIDANTGYVVGSNGTIYKSIDSGTTWYSLSSGTINDLYSVYFPNASAGYAVGDNGTVLITGKCIEGLADGSRESNILRFSPNPSSSQIIIETSEVPVNGQLSILDIEGKCYISRQITDSNTKIDISHLSNGVYIIRLTNSRTVESGKLIKQ